MADWKDTTMVVHLAVLKVDWKAGQMADSMAEGKAGLWAEQTAASTVANWAAH